MIRTCQVFIFELKPLKRLPLVSRASSHSTGDYSVQFSIMRYPAFSICLCIAILIAHVALYVCLFLKWLAP